MVGAWQELIKSNMSKLNSPVFREDGKLTKNPKTFIEANFKPFTGWYRV
jgi:hypothetical protein